MAGGGPNVGSIARNPDDVARQQFKNAADDGVIGFQFRSSDAADKVLTAQI